MRYQQAVKADTESHALNRSARLSGAPLALARAAWIVTTLVVVGLLGVAMPLAYQQIITPQTGPQCADSRFSPTQFAYMHAAGVSPEALGAWVIGIACYSTLVYIGVGTLLFWRRSDNRVALLAATALVLWSSSNDSHWLGSSCALHAAWPTAGLLFDLLGLVGGVLLPVLFYIFPSGQWVPRWSKWLILGWILITLPELPRVLVSALAGDFITSHLLWIGNASAGLLFATLPFAQVYRYRRVSTPVERLQTKWVVLGAGLGLGGAAAGIAWGAFGGYNPTAPWWPMVFRSLGAAIQVCGTLVPISIGIALLRSHLWDIDILISRTLVYGALTLSVVGCYILAVGYLGALFGAGGNLLISLIATGIVALLFQPLRGWLQRGVNRLLYGQRDEPYVVVAQLGRRLESTLAPEAMLPAIIETVAQALKLPYAAIALKRGDELHSEAVYGTPVEAALTLPLVYQAETVGQLTLGPRQRGETFTPADKRLLEDLARQIGVAAHAVQLTADLQRSRERLVLAREEERRRLRRDLHDGLGPTLAALALKASAVGELIPDAPDTASALATELTGDLRATIGEIRRLVYALRPPVLDELGLLAAVREGAEQYRDVAGAPAMTLMLPASLPPLPAAVEVAALRITQEALTNTVRHSGAMTCAVEIACEDGSLTLSVSDDGAGIPEVAHVGVGLRSMRERAEELGGSCAITSAPGGGLRVDVSLPLASQSATAVSHVNTSDGSVTGAEAS